MCVCGHIPIPVSGVRPMLFVADRHGGFLGIANEEHSVQPCLVYIHTANTINLLLTVIRGLPKHTLSIQEFETVELNRMP